jgi:short-subunit dehydrogenase
MRIGPGTRALVTGASRGIGRALARALAARGAQVGLVARDGEALERLAAELPGARALAADVGDREAIAGAVGAFAAQGLDLVVANAGIAHYGAFARTPLERAEEMTRVNWLGTLYTVHAALPHLGGDGHIVVVSSGAGLRAFPEAAAYGATKAAQRAFAEALRHELAGTGVSVTTVLPGEVDTELHAHERERMPAWYGARKAPPDRLAQAVIAAVEADRRTLAHPREVALLGLNGLAPGLTDRILRRLRGAAAAPRTR